jgi:predicted nuclease of predicted toxin-antitoxin system
LKFLIDESVSPLVARELASAGHDATHVHGIGLTGASDRRILEHAASEDRVLVTLDTDFGALIAHSGSSVPSVILFRGEVTRRPLAQVELLLANLDQVTEDVTAGAVVVIGDERVRVRRLPIERL